MREAKEARKGVYNQSTEKALALIEFLAAQSQPVSLQQISQQMGINNSTAYRFLLSLEQCGYLIHDSEQGKYALSMKICTIAHQVALNNDLRRIVGPYLRRLGDAYGGFVCLSVENDMRVVYIDSYGKDQLVKPFVYIGKTAPMHCTGTGKLFLTNLDDEQLRYFAERTGLEKNTANTITSLEALKEELARVRANDYATDVEECEFGACCVAVPLRDFSGRVAAGISITGSVSQMTHMLVGNNLQGLISAAKEISEILGYTRG